MGGRRYRAAALRSTRRAADAALVDATSERGLGEAVARARRVVAVVCAWCHASLGVRPASPVVAGAVSHGLCRACARRLTARR